jgi:hypothetical protein
MGGVGCAVHAFPMAGRRAYPFSVPRLPGSPLRRASVFQRGQRTFPCVLNGKGHHERVVLCDNALCQAIIATYKGKSEDIPFVSLGCTAKPRRSHRVQLLLILSIIHPQEEQPDPATSTSALHALDRFSPHRPLGI